MSPLSLLQRPGLPAARALALPVMLFAGCQSATDFEAEGGLSLLQVTAPDSVINLSVSRELRLQVTAIERNARTIPKVDRLTFRSSDPTVAEVDANGTVTARQFGDTEISVTAEHGGASRTASIPLQAVAQDLASAPGTYDLVGTVESSRADTTSLVGYSHHMTFRLSPSSSGQLGGYFQSWTLRDRTSSISALADSGTVATRLARTVIRQFVLSDTSGYFMVSLVPLRITPNRIEGRFESFSRDWDSFRSDSRGSFVAIRR